MPGATASGAETNAGASARPREHNQGNQDRSYTVEQKAAVLRIRRCSPTSFYDILGLESVKSTVTDTEIKKAYRKLSLLTHPDKNGHEHADEAFKMVSRAFGVLGDKEKREKFDRFGTDPDSRFASAQAQNPFSGFGSRQASGGGGGGGMGGGGMWQDEMSPEEMFQRFFGGGGFGGPFGAFDTGPQFVFNFGGGPGIRVHQFGGPRPRRRPRDGEGGEQNSSVLQTIIGLLPIIFFLILPILSSLFSSDEPTLPSMRFDKPIPPHTSKRQTPKYNANYYLDPNTIASLSPAELRKLDMEADNEYVRQLKVACAAQKDNRERLMYEAQGWIFPDHAKMEQARNYEMPACNQLQKIGQGW